MNLRDTEGLASSLNGIAALTPRSAGWPYVDEPPESPANASAVEWKTYWRSIWRRRWIVLALAAAATTAAMLYAHSMQPVFRSTTTILIESSKAKILSIEDVYGGASQDREYYQTQVEILRSRDVALRTVTATKLWDEPEFDPRKPAEGLMARIRGLISPPYEPPVWTPELLAEATVGKYLASVAIEPVRLSQLVKISFESTDRKLAAKIADAAAGAFIESDRDARVKLNVSVSEQLTERLNGLRDKLRQSEQDLQTFRESAGLVAVSGGQNIAGQQMVELSQRLVQARVRRTELETAFQQIDQASDVSSIAALGSRSDVSEARGRVAAATARVEELTLTRGEGDPRVIEARAALTLARQQLQSAARSAIDALRSELRAARANEASLQGALGSARSAVQGVNRQEFQLGVLEREVQTNKQLYELLLNRTKETSVNTNLQSAVARIVDAATPGGAPVRPNKPQMVMVVLLATLGASAAFFILFDRFNRTVQASDDVEQRLHQRVLATLPKVTSAGDQSLARLFLDEPTSSHANSIRHVRTSMLMSAPTHKMVVVTSSRQGEGKTTLCTNLALAHAKNKRTVLLDCNFRSPQIGKRLGLPADALGISDFVQGKAKARNCIHPIPGSRLLVMPVGTTPGEPDDMLLSPSFQNLLRSLSNRVEVVLIDAPAVSEGSDALIIAQHVQDIMYVVKAHHTSRQEARRGLERLRCVGANILGILLTNVSAKEMAAEPSPVLHGNTLNVNTVFGV